jgi:hypothetical protein
VPNWRAAGAGAAAGACAIKLKPQAEKIAAGSGKLALSVALRNTAIPFNIALPLKIDAIFTVVASG